MKQTKIYLLGPISPFNTVRSENFVKGVNTLRNLNFDVDCCADLLITDEVWKQTDLFKKRMDAAVASQHVVLLKDYEYDEEAIVIKNAAKRCGVPIHSYDEFLTNYEKYATATETTTVTE